MNSSGNFVKSVFAHTFLNLAKQFILMESRDHHHNLFYTSRVYIQYNKICSNSKVHGIAKALNFYK